MSTAIDSRGDQFDDGEDGTALPVCECGAECSRHGDRICDECWYAERAAKRAQLSAREYDGRTVAL